MNLIIAACKYAANAWINLWNWERKADEEQMCQKHISNDNSDFSN